MILKQMKRLERRSKVDSEERERERERERKRGKVERGWVKERKERETERVESLD